MNPIRPDQQMSVIELQHRTHEHEHEIANIRLAQQALDGNPNDEQTNMEISSQTTVRRVIAALATIITLR